MATSKRAETPTIGPAPRAAWPENVQIWALDDLMRALSEPATAR